MATKKSFNSISVPELKTELKKEGLSLTGKKQELYDRLYGSQSKTTTTTKNNKSVKANIEPKSDADSESENEEPTTKKAKSKKKRLSVGPKSFSKWKWPNVCKKLGIVDPNPIVDEERFPEHERDRDKMEECIDFVKRGLVSQQAAQLDKLGHGNEDVRAHYVMTILKKVMKFFSITKTLAISTEHLLGSDEGSWGPVEFVITARNSERFPVGFVVETKKDDFEQGRAQLYMQLKVEHEANVEEGEEWEIMGAITNAKTWVFVTYDGERFYESEEYTMGSSPAFSNLRIVVEWLVAILDYVSNSMNDE